MASPLNRQENAESMVLRRASQLEAVLRGMGDGLVLRDKSNRILMINAAAVRMNGFDNEAQARATFENLTAIATSVNSGNIEKGRETVVGGFSLFDEKGSALPFSEWPFNKAYRHEPFENFEVTISNKITGYSWVGRFNGVRIPNEDGVEALFVTTMQDITGERRAERDLAEANRRLGLLQEAVALLMASDEPLKLLDGLYRQLAEVLKVEFYFYFSDIDGKNFRLISSRGIPNETAEMLSRLAFEDAICGRAAIERQTIVLEDVQSQNDEMTNFIRQIGIDAYVCHPLIAHGEVMGALSFGTRRYKQFDKGEIKLIRAVCDQVAIALERDRSRTRLSQSEERMRLALDAGHMGAFDWNLRSDTLVWDAAICRMYGATPGYAIDISEFWKRVHPDDQPGLEKLLKQYLDGMSGQFLDVEFRIVRPDGEIRWIAGRGRVSRDERGQPLRINGINFDITERRRGDEIQRLAHIAGQLVTFYWDIPSDRLEFDQQFEIVYGFKPKEGVSNYKSWIACVHPDDRAPVRRAMHACIEKGETSWQYEFRIIRPSGEIRWIEARATVFYDSDGTHRATVGVNVDITARRQAEQALRHSEARFRRLSESGIVGIAFFRVDGRIVDANERFMSMIGASRAEIEAGLLRWDVLTPPEWMPRTRRAIAEFNATGRITPYEKEYFRRDGNKFWALLGSAKLDDEGNGVSFVIDITQRKRAEEALREADRRKDDFLAALGHELRNPLAPIRNAMQILQLKAGDEPHVRWAAEVTERQVQQMTRLVDDLLDVSRINRGQLELRCEVIDLTDVVKRSVEMTMPLIERRRHEFNLEIPGKSIFAKGDSARLTQVVANLINNAAKFTPPAGVISVTLESDKENAIVRVRDNGIGMPPTALKEIFEPFRQFNKGPGQEHAGLGLGLALVHRLIALHDGDVRALSEGEGKGSEFFIRLPLANRVESAQNASLARSKEMTKHLRVVVVDDNRDVAESLATLLEMLGHEAHAVFNGASAIEAAQRLQPNIVFCDIGLPDFSGHEVASRLRKEPNFSKTHLVAMTGFARDSEKAKAAGFDEWFLKPVDLTVLQSVLERTYRHAQISDEHSRKRSS